MIKNLLFVLFVLIFVGLIVANILYYSKKSISKNYKLPLLIGVIVSLILLILVPSSFHQVETGTIAVVRHLGKITDIRNPGTYFDFYMTNTYEIYDAKVQQDRITTSAYSKDGQTMDLEVFLQYQVQTENIIKIATEYGNLDALQARIETVTIEKTKSVMSSAEAMTIVQNRSKFSNDVSSAVRDGISGDYYVNVRDVVLTNIDFTDEFEKSVENKVIAEQDKQASITKAEAELEVAKLEAQRKIAEAEGNAEAQKIIAQATAEAATSKIIEVAKSIGYEIKSSYVYLVTTETDIDGNVSIEKEEITSNEKLKEETSSETIQENEQVKTVTRTVSLRRTINEIDVTTGPGQEKFKSLVEDYLQYLAYLDKWDGVLPTVVSGEDALSIIIPNE